jgi:hypothetical protein
MIMVAIAYGFRYNLDENLIKAGMWSPYNIIRIGAFEGRRCRPRALNHMQIPDLSMTKVCDALLPTGNDTQSLASNSPPAVPVTSDRTALEPRTPVLSS